MGATQLGKQGTAVLKVCVGLCACVLCAVAAAAAAAGNETIPVDEAGNPKLRDIGLFLKAAIKQHLPDTDVKYIDPSNMVQVSGPSPPRAFAVLGVEC